MSAHLERKHNNKSDHENKFGIPWTYYEPNQTAHLGSTSEVVNPAFPTPFNYTIYDHAFRTVPKDPTKPVTIFAGCSMTFGIGSPVEDTWPAMVAKELGVEDQYVNMGIPGSGPDAQIVNLHWALDNYKIDRIFWFMSDPHRQVVYQNDRFSCYVPPDTNFFHDKNFGEKFVEVNTMLYDTIWIKTYWDVYGLFSRIAEKKIPTNMSCWWGRCDYDLIPLREQFGIKPLGKIKSIDLARDNRHPGVQSHEYLTKQIIANL